MAGPLRRLIAKRPLRNAIRRAAGLPQIGGQSAALSESRTAARRLGRNRPTEPQFRSIGDKSVRSDLRGAKSKPGVPVAPTQTDADAPDTTPNRVFKQSDPDALNGKMKAAAASDNAQKTDLDAGPRKVGGRDVTAQMADGSDQAIRAGIKVDAPIRVNTTEVSVKPDAQAVAIRDARQQDEARRVQKRKASEGLGASPPERPSIARPDVTAMQGQYDELLGRARQQRAMAESLRQSPGYNNDPELRVARQYSDAITEAELAEMRAMSLAEKIAALGMVADKDNADLAFKYEDIASRDRAANAQFPDPAVQLNRNLDTMPDTVARLGIREAGNAAAASDIAVHEGNLKAPLDQAQKDKLLERNLTVASVVGLSTALENRERMTPDSPLVQELASIAMQFHQNDPAKRQMFVNNIATAAIQRAVANGAQLSEGATGQLQSALNALVERTVAGMPRPQQGGGMIKWLQSYGDPASWGFGKPQNMGGM